MFASHLRFKVDLQLTSLSKEEILQSFALVFMASLFHDFNKR